MVKKVFIIAGEASGDLLGAKLMSEMHTKGNFRFYGIGGKAMIEEGLESIFPMEKISLMGFLEILPKIFMLLKLIDLTVLEIKKFSPDIFVSIDSPGFCFRVAANVQKLGFKLIHYVAPSVWAYKPQRARKIATLYDYIISILPFEPPYFIEQGVFCKFIGHPITEDPKGVKELFMQKYNFSDHDDILCIMPGSRRNEINKLLPIFIETAQLLQQKFPNLHLVVIAFEDFVQEITQAFSDKNLKVLVVSSQDKLNAIAAAKVALVKSGTSSLEVAYNTYGGGL
jgi:lipid-A-disaccharide synthase